jgi:hypothetical protein
MLQCITTTGTFYPVVRRTMLELHDERGYHNRHSFKKSLDPIHQSCVSQRVRVLVFLRFQSFGDAVVISRFWETYPVVKSMFWL